MSAESSGSQGLTAAERLGQLAESLSDCRKCGLSEGRTHVVFGVGSAEAKLMFVGEGPGFHEDRQGEPFVGQAGKLLNELLGGIELSRDEVYIANVVKCRPPENRDPASEEIETCSPHLFQQVEIIRPSIICTLGRFATKLLADTELSITAIHGKAKEVEVGGVPVLLFPVFHPAAALYTHANRSVLEEDFAKLRVLLDKGPGALAAGGPTEVEPPSDKRAEVQGAPVEQPKAGTHESEGRETDDKSSQSAEQLPLW